MPALTMCWKQHCECLKVSNERIVCKVTSKEPEMQYHCPLAREVL